MIDQDTLTAQINEIDSDGDIIDLGDGRHLRIRIEHDGMDAFDEINGADCWGKVAWPEREYNYHTRNKVDKRPKGFTGRAVKLHTMGGDNFWWEPYYEPGTPFVSPSWQERRYMQELVTFGFYLVGVELFEKVTDSRAHEHDVRVNNAYLGGIDTLDTYPSGFDGPVLMYDYLRTEILPGLIAEVLA